MPWSLQGQDKQGQRISRMSYCQKCTHCKGSRCITCAKSRCTDEDTFNKIAQREIEHLEFSCSSLYSLVELASANMHAVRHTRPDPGDAGGAAASAPGSSSKDAPPPAIRRTKRKSYILAESLATTANERAQSAFNQHLQATSLQDMD